MTTTSKGTSARETLMSQLDSIDRALTGIDSAMTKLKALSGELDGPTGICDKDGVEVPLEVHTTPVGESTTKVTVYSEGGLKSRVVLNADVAENIAELVAEADSLAQDHNVEEAHDRLFSHFLDYWIDCVGTLMSREELAFMSISDEFHAYKAGVAKGIDIERAYNRIPYAAVEAVSGT